MFSRKGFMPVTSSSKALERNTATTTRRYKSQETYSRVMCQISKIGLSSILTNVKMAIAAKVKPTRVRRLMKSNRLVVDKSFSNVELSKFLGVHAVTISRLLSRLQREGVIKREEEGIVILDNQRLHDYMLALSGV